MDDEKIERIMAEANYIIKTGATVRETAKNFCYSKSTIHKDVSYKLKEIDKNLYEMVKRVLNKNLAERHLRGGEATKNKYKKIKAK